MRFLKTISPDNMADHGKQMLKFNVGEDSPVFDGLYQFCQASSGGSIGGAVKLNRGTADVVCLNDGTCLHLAFTPEMDPPSYRAGATRRV